MGNTKHYFLEGKIKSDEKLDAKLLKPIFSSYTPVAFTIEDNGDFIAAVTSHSTNADFGGFAPDTNGMASCTCGATRRRQEERAKREAARPQKG